MGILDDLKLQYKVGDITQRLIFWNVGLFLFPMILFSVLSLFNVEVPFLRWDLANAEDWLSLSSNPQDLLWKPWSLITYAFLHANFLHILFNMMVLYFSGRLFLTFFTQKQLLGLYVVAGVFSGLIFILSYNLLPMLTTRPYESKLVGASASIMAILIAAAVYAPYYQIRLMLIGVVKLWHIAVVLIILDLIQVSAENTGGHLAHLAGAFFGFIYVKSLKKGTDFSKSVTLIINFFTNLFKKKESIPFKKVYKNTGNTHRPVAKPAKDRTQKQIDEILDKISKSGYNSLTKEEKDFLFKVGK